MYLSSLPLPSFSLKIHSHNPLIYPSYPCIIHSIYSWGYRKHSSNITCSITSAHVDGWKRLMGGSISSLRVAWNRSNKVIYSVIIFSLYIFFLLYFCSFYWRGSIVPKTYNITRRAYEMFKQPARSNNVWLPHFTSSHLSIFRLYCTISALTVVPSLKWILTLC